MSSVTQQGYFFPSVICAFGFLVFAHASWLTIQYRHQLKMDALEFEYAPTVVIAECAVAAFLTMFAGMSLAGTLKPIRSELAESANESLNFRPDFVPLYQGRTHAIRR
ncbi:membrane magnesium transporter 1 [Pycnococcus provasolii]